MDGIDGKLDELYEEIDGLMKNGAFEECDEILRRVDVVRTDTDLLIGYLTTTLPGKSKLHSRPGFYKQVEEELKRRRNYTPCLLRGLA